MTLKDHIREKTNKGWNVLLPAAMTALVLIVNTIFGAGVKSEKIATLETQVAALQGARRELELVKPDLLKVIADGDNVILGRVTTDKDELDRTKTEVAVLKSELSEIKKTVDKFDKKLDDLLLAMAKARK